MHPTIYNTLAIKTLIHVHALYSRNTRLLAGKPPWSIQEGAQETIIHNCLPLLRPGEQYFGIVRLRDLCKCNLSPGHTPTRDGNKYELTEMK